jgi:hypothetical protein
MVTYVGTVVMQIVAPSDYGHACTIQYFSLSEVLTHTVFPDLGKLTSSDDCLALY